MHSKYMPYELVENLADVFIATDTKPNANFYAVGTDATIALTLLTEEQVSKFNERYNLDDLSLDRLGPH